MTLQAGLLRTLIIVNYFNGFKEIRMRRQETLTISGCILNSC